MENSAPAVNNRKSLFSLLLPYLLITPTFILILMFTLGPSINTVIDSLYQPARRAADPAEFVGLDNYTDLFNPSHYLGGRFMPILGNTVIFAVGTVMISVPLALLLAILLNRPVRFMGFWRFSVFYPSLLPLIGAASIFAFIFSDTVGLANAILKTFGLGRVNWLGNPNMVLWSVILVNIWKQTGYYMLFYLAGLQNIPRELYEAADLDGANTWQKFFRLTVPLLRRTTLFIMVVAFTFGFQTVEQLAALGQGNPADRANMLLWFIFQNIGERRNWGYVNAMTVVLVVILLVFTVTNFVLFERGREDDE
jgi:sn-glycerol 3-phosphate transport system permease protein